MATPEVHKQRMRQEALRTISELMFSFDISTKDLEGFSTKTRLEELNEHRHRAEALKAHAERSRRATEARKLQAQQKREAQQSD